MPSITSCGVPFAYDDIGRGSPVLLLHAGITDRRMWDDVVPALSNGHRIVRFDMRGFGDTPAQPGKFVDANDAAELLSALGIRRAHVCGVSLGAGVALDLTLGHPELVDHLALVAPGLPGWDWGAAMEEFDASETAALEAGDLDEASWLNVRFWLDGPFRSAEDVDPDLRRRVFEMQRRAFELDNPQAQRDWLVQNRRERLSEVTAPTLIVVGDLDQPDFLEIARWTHERIPDSRLETVAGVAHLPPMEAPEVFSGLLVEHFLP